MLNLLMSSLALLNVDGVVTFLLISKIYGTLNRISRLERKGFTSIQQHRNVNLAMHAMFPHYAWKFKLFPRIIYDT